MKKLIYTGLIGVTLIGLSACSGTKNTLGLTKSVPDEFVVVKRAPLSIPPDYTLRPPQPGAARSQEATAAQDAQTAVFGGSQSTTQAASGESAFLRQAANTEADPNIRAKLNEELTINKSDNRPVIKRLMNPSGKGEEADAIIVDAAKEKERLLTNAEEGKSIIDGVTPTVEK
jgi:hypothetical protein